MLNEIYIFTLSTQIEIPHLAISSESQIVLSIRVGCNLKYLILRLTWNWLRTLCL